MTGQFGKPDIKHLNLRKITSYGTKHLLISAWLDFQGIEDQIIMTWDGDWKR